MGADHTSVQQLLRDAHEAGVVAGVAGGGVETQDHAQQGPPSQLRISPRRSCFSPALSSWATRRPVERLGSARSL